MARKIHFGLWRTIYADWKTICGKRVREVDMSCKIPEVTCKACLRKLVADGEKALKKLIKLCPMYGRIIPNKEAWKHGV